ncbi:hypothetical protein EV644_107183 [Kribbella orskensis]|uniref:Uncharacterized protein n=1 Tax=Kribbella orskensis TaxID=2512216 RepID=A0ABY2BJP1_9ACTN|nr:MULTISPECIES: hypothetical protein [Kribbella]TCN39214.1 hypothetical protein EV642_107183 [Kribbella sp. VKM Ac-2500]TCO21861.1 hypothetical protein EV644_107183 [Kribbella orskensis]
MPVHVFVDETKTRGLLMAAARCAADDVAVNRKALRGLLLSGQERNSGAWRPLSGTTRRRRSV